MLNKLRLRLRALLFKSKMEEELDEEVRFHLEREIEENIVRGMTPEEARYAAMRSFGGVERVKEESRDERGIRLLEEVWQDLRYGARMLLKQPGFTLIAALTLALGIGANTAIFSVVEALLLRPLPYSEPERLMMLSEKSREGARLTAAYPNFADWRARAQSFEGMASIRSQAMNLTGVERPMRLRGRTVNWNFFQLLGVGPQLGRLFDEADDRYGAPRTALLGYELWKELFGGETSVIGRAINIDDEAYTVIGVLPPGFEYFRRADVYAPIGLFLRPNSGLADRGSSLGLSAVARLKPGVTLQQANSEMATLGAQLAQEYPAINGGKSAMAERLQDVMSEDVRLSLWVLLGAVGFILLIACTNVANLLLVRAAERQKEMAVRLALGAPAWRIVRQLLSESILIGGLGGAFGLLAGRLMLDALLTLAPEEIPQLGRVGLDRGVLLFALGVTAATSVLCALLPALHAARIDLRPALQEGGRAPTGAAREGMRKALLVAEVSMALVLLSGAGLLVRSMYNLLHVQLGFNADNLLTMRLNLSGKKYNPDETDRVFYDECLTRVNALPGVRAAALTNSLPIDGSDYVTFFTAADKPVPTRADLPKTDYVLVSANYFETMGIHLLRGRSFNSSDTAESAPVVVINETMARRMWPGEDPIGKRVKQGYPESQTPWREVVGVVNDVKLNGVERETSMQTYLPFVQFPGANLGLVVRANQPLAAAAAVEQAIHMIDKDLPVYAALTMGQMLGHSLATRRLTLVLLSSFAVLALLLAALGIYGVTSYGVTQRTREIGIRVAFGARVSDVLRVVIGQGMKSALLGIVVGLGGAFALTRLIANLLFQVNTIDAFTFASVTLLLILVALVACFLPARRAAKVDPLVALRKE
jgi:putative ABC transport system permease protein